ncbi:MAG: hypothetical protein STSR0008_04260 [Ignavibacterium sp.]
MKKLLLMLLFSTIVTFSQSINGRFTSSYYSFERYDTVGNSDQYLRSYQMLSLNVVQNKFALRTSLSLEDDLMRSISYDARLRFYNLYIEGRNLFNIATVKLGRQPIINSVAGGLFDGISVNINHKILQSKIYYGGNVPAYQKFDITDKWSEDYILGGKISTTALHNFIISLSYLNKNFKSDEYWTTRLDENFNPHKVLVNRGSSAYEFITGEVNYSSQNLININTKYDYDLNYSKTYRFETYARYDQIKNLGIELYYNYKEPLIRYNSYFSIFDGIVENTQEIEVGVDYKINSMFTAQAKFGDVEYKDENSQRLTLGLITGYGTINYRKNFGYAGELDAISVFSSYPFFKGLLTPSIGFAYSSYKLSEDDKDNSTTTLLIGTNFRPLRALSFDIQCQYANNKIYKNDFRFFFKINHWFNTKLNLM